jgi:hypothetical protein
MDPHETDRHGSFSDERRTDPPLNRTMIKYGTVHSSVRSTVTVGPSGPFQTTTLHTLVLV